jgi:tRNA wybutosine-synthesizing protein 3
MSKHLIPQDVKLDKSPKGFIDPPIVPFMELINTGGDYETTSSCSGRIAIFAEKTGQATGFWMFVSHEKVSKYDYTLLFGGKQVVSLDDEQVPETENLQLIFFKFEPFILHVSSPDAEKGQSFLNACFDAGYRTSGLVNGKKRCMIVVKDTLKLDAPIGYYDPAQEKVYLIVSPSYLDLLMSLSYKKFEENENRMQKLYDKLTEFLQPVVENK